MAEKASTKAGRGGSIEQFLTIEDVAQRLRVDERTVHRWISDGKLVRHKFGRAVRIALSDLQRFIAQHRQP
jgi:excisionase family DNA binding protein